VRRGASLDRNCDVAIVAAVSITMSGKRQAVKASLAPLPGFCVMPKKRGAEGRLNRKML
jgi:hypothetical protein